MEESNMFRKLALWTGALLMAASLTGCGYNEFQRLDEATNASWQQVVNQYQRRADLIPNIVNAGSFVLQLHPNSCR